MSDLYTAALAAHDAGLCVIPAANNGSKRPYPDRGEWHEYTEHRPTEGQLVSFFADGRYSGMGIVCGAVSGNVELLEFEGRAVDAGMWQDFLTAARETGLGDVITHIIDGYCERSPSGGYHLLYCCDAVSGSRKLASRPATADELVANPDEKIKVLIETKGEGGFVILAPSNGSTHPSGGSWELQSGGFDSIATISAAQRQALHELARLFDEHPVPMWEGTAAQKTGGRPGDGFNRDGDINGIVVPALVAEGWAAVSHIRRDGNELWRRPGKEIGHSATLHRGKRVFFVHSTSTGFPEAPKGYSMFQTLVFAAFKGDFSAAARWCRDQGYGDKEPTEEDLDNYVREANAPNIAASQGRKPQTLAALLTHEDDEYDWLIADLLERGDRVVLTGKEGEGKSTLLRQIGICAAAGLHPFTGAAMEPLRVLLIDCENSTRQLRREFTKALSPLTPQQRAEVAQRFFVEVHTEGLVLDVGKDPDGDRAWLEDMVKGCEPDIVILGPIYKIIQGDANDEEPCRELVKFLDRLRGRYGFAIMLEAHTPHDAKRPYGWSGWKRWPEFGLHLDEGGELSRWRGDRDARAWPERLARGGEDEWLWKTTVAAISPRADSHEKLVIDAQVEVLKAMRLADVPLTRQEVLDRVGKRKAIAVVAFSRLSDRKAFVVTKDDRTDAMGRKYAVDLFGIDPHGPFVGDG